MSVDRRKRADSYHCQMSEAVFLLHVVRWTVEDGFVSFPIDRDSKRSRTGGLGVDLVVDLINRGSHPATARRWS